MSPQPSPNHELTLRDAIRIPDHVVYRAFPAETVVLNLNTAKYHGLNPTGGRMLEAAERAGSLEEAAKRLAEEYGQPTDEIERDLLKFCDELISRDLLELRSP